MEVSGSGFVRTKEIPPGSSNWYAYRVKNYRDENGEHQQEVLEYLGPVGSEEPSKGEVKELIEEKEKPSPEEILPESVSLTVEGEPPEETVRGLSEFFSNISNETIERRVNDIYITSESADRKAKTGGTLAGSYLSHKNRIKLYDVREEKDVLDKGKNFRRDTLLHEATHGMFYDLIDRGIQSFFDYGIRTEEGENDLPISRVKSGVETVKEKKKEAVKDFAKRKRTEIEEEIEELENIEGVGLSHEEWKEYEDEKLEEIEHDDDEEEIDMLRRKEKMRHRKTDLENLKSNLKSIEEGFFERNLKNVKNRLKTQKESDKERPLFEKIAEEEFKGETEEGEIGFQFEEFEKIKSDPVSFLEGNIELAEETSKEDLEKVKEKKKENLKAREKIEELTKVSIQEGALTEYSSKYENMLTSDDPEDNIDENLEEAVMESIEELKNKRKEFKPKEVKNWQEEPWGLFKLVEKHDRLKRFVNENLAVALEETMRKSIESTDPEDRKGEGILVEELISEEGDREVSEERLKKDLRQALTKGYLEEDSDFKQKTGKTVLGIMEDEWNLDLEEFKEYLEDWEGSN